MTQRDTRCRRISRRLRGILSPRGCCWRRINVDVSTVDSNHNVITRPHLQISHLPGFLFETESWGHSNCSAIIPSTVLFCLSFFYGTHGVLEALIGGETELTLEGQGTRSSLKICNIRARFTYGADNAEIVSS